MTQQEGKRIKMDKKQFQEKLQKRSKEVLAELEEWREKNPTATLREIETEIDKQFAVLRAEAMSEMAMQSKKADWVQSKTEVMCENCGEPLTGHGKKKRVLVTNYDKTVEIEREYGSCPKCKTGFFPPR